MDFKPEFLIIPYILFEDKGLQQLDRTLYGVIYYFERMKYGYCKASNNSLAEFCKATQGSIKNSLERLEKNGHIKRSFDKDGNRKNITCLVKMDKSKTIKSDTPSSTDDPPRHLQMTPPSSTDDQIRNIDKEYKISTIAKASFAQENHDIHIIPNLSTSNYKYIQIIGLYAEKTGIVFASKEIQSSFIKRNARIAKLLEPYDKDTISEVMDELCKTADYKWTLETVSKFIDRPIMRKKPSKNVII